MEFIYTNLNPAKEHTDDCVTRAIALATNSDYYDIQEKLYLTSSLFSCPRLSVLCYENLLENVFGCIPVYCNNMTVSEFADENPYGTYLIRLEGHLTVVINSCLYDTFDCGDELCDLAWYVPQNV